MASGESNLNITIRVPPFLYTTVDAVKTRLGTTNIASVSDADITENIVDATGYINYATESTWTTNAPQIVITTATDLAAAYTLIRLNGGKLSGLKYSLGKLSVDKSKEGVNLLNTIKALMSKVDANMALLMKNTIGNLTSGKVYGENSPEWNWYSDDRNDEFGGEDD